MKCIDKENESFHFDKKGNKKRTSEEKKYFESEKKRLKKKNPLIDKDTYTRDVGIWHR